MRLWFNGRTSPCQGDDRGSIPLSRSMRSLTWLSLFFIGAPALLFYSVSTLVSSTLPPISASPVSPEVLGSNITIFSNSVQPPSLTNLLLTGDARTLIIASYLSRHRSVLEPYAAQIVAVSDKYLLDYRLLVAIAQQESNLCKKIPVGSHNCWGFGIYGDNVIRFTSYPEALETVAKTLKNKYVNYGLDTPEKIMVKYTPPSLEKDGAWAKGINQFLSELE